MKQKSSTRSLNFDSYNRKSRTCLVFDRLRLRACRREPCRKIQKQKWDWIIVVSVILAIGGDVAHAQPSGKISRIGFLSNFDAPSERQLKALQEGLRDLGYIEGKNILIEYRHPDERVEAPALVSELLQLKIDILIAADPTSVRAAKQATKTIPIVMVTNQDPVATGLVDSLPRPGGNVTGITRLTRELSGKRLELLKEIVPTISRVGVLWVRPTALGLGNAFQNYEPTADALKIQLQSLQVLRPNPDLEGAFREAINARVNALITVSNAVLGRHAKKIAELAVKNRLPSMCEASQYVDAGCQISYSTNDVETNRRAAIYVDKILKGAKPADLPIEQASKFELAINLKTAKQIGVTIPPNVLARADRVIR